MEARCREHAVDSPAALPLYLEAGFLLCLHSWLVRHQRRVAAGRSRIPITCPLNSLPKPSMCPRASWKPQFGGCRPPELFCQDVDGTATAVMRGRPPRREGRYQCDRGGVLHGHRRCTVAGGWSDFYPHLSRPDFLSMVTAASS